jgi:type IV pilus assembly protein PilW
MDDAQRRGAQVRHEHDRGEEGKLKMHDTAPNRYTMGPPIGARAQRGFTLVELMVGLLLGLLTVLVITQVLALAEGRTRTISSGSDAQVNGALAMFTLQRDIQQAGYGLAANPDALGCAVHAKFNAGAAFTFSLAPVVIADGASGAPDTITILQGSSAASSTPIALTADHVTTDSQFVVESSLGASAGDTMIVVPQGGLWESAPTTSWCTLFSVTADASNLLSATRIPHVGTGWNQSSVMPSSKYDGSSLATQPRSYLLNMGAVIQRTYSISALGNLQVTERSPADGTTTTPVDLYPQIVNLQALYGKDTNADGVIDTYDNVTPTTNVGWQQVLAVRIAVVARSTQYEKEVVTTTAPQWDLGSTATITDPAAATCNGTHKCIALTVNSQTDWQHYRYKIYDTIVPLRNMLWNS